MKGESTELREERTPTNRVFANPDGTRTTRAFSAPVNMKDASGKWVDIDTTLERGQDGRFRPKATPVAQEFSANAADAVVGRIVVDPSHSIGFGIAGASELSRATPSGSKVTYPGVIGSASVTLTAKPNGVKEEIVLDGPDSPNTFDFPLRLVGLTAEVDVPTGDVVYRDKDGHERARTPHGYMQEASAGRPRPEVATSDGVTYSVVPGEDGNQVLRTVLDAQWLADPARQWPVTVDPSYWLSTDFQDDTFVKSGTTQDYAWLDYLAVGTWNAGANKFRSFLNFDLTQLTGRTILSADFHIFLSYSPTCTARGVGFYRATTAWGGHTMTSWPGVNYADQVAWANMAMGGPGCGPGWASFYDNNSGGNITSHVLDAVRNWTTAGGWGNFGLVVKADDENDNWAYKSFDSWDTWGGDPGCTPNICSEPEAGIPHIDIDWNAPPSVPALSSPGNGASFHTTTPTLSASSSDANGDPIYYQYELCGPIYGANQCAASEWTTGAWTVPSGWLVSPSNQSYTWHARASDLVAPDTAWSGNWGFTVTNATPTISPQTPTTQSVLGTTTLSFTGTGGDADGDTTNYRFQVATGADGHTGRLATSTWSTSLTWDPPSGTFSDGGTYSWIAQAQDDRGATSAWSTPQSFRIDFRLGKRQTLPYDTVGPVDVNLSNGNVVLTTAGPSFPTVGDPVGVSLTYNSQTPVVHGLTGDYHQDKDSDGVLDAGEPRLLHRIDPTLTFAWGSPGDGPNPGVLKPERWIGKWTGSIRVPAGQDGNWVFVSAGSDDSVVLKVNGTTKLTATAPGATVQGTPVALSSTSGAALDLTYVQVTGPESLRIRIRKESDPVGSEYDIPSDWFTPTQPSLPDGWSRAGDSLVPDAFTAVRPVTGSTTAVVDSDGTDHLFTWTGSSWAPPPGEDSVLTQLANGSWSLEGEDGYLYSFGLEGRLESVVSAVDDVKPGAPTYGFGTPNNDGVVRMTSITDAANRAILLRYAPSSNCPSAVSGLDASAPTNMLCRIDYSAFGSGTMDLYYSNGHLARIVQPGGATIDFGYDSTGLLRSVRDVLTNDLIAGGTITSNPTNEDKYKTLIDYTSGRATSVKAPVADAAMTDVQRPHHTYGYTVNGSTNQVTEATVHVAGQDNHPTSGNPTRRVTLDAAGHATSITDQAGITDDHTWDAFNDRPDRTVDRHVLTSPAGGLVTTKKYDAAGRVTDTYGPALAGEWTNGTPSATVPTTHTNYDENIPGLAGTWYASPDLTGAAKLHTTDTLNDNWGASSPGTDVPSDNFSGRLTGEIVLPSAGTLTLAADGGRIFVDDANKTDAVTGGDTWGGPYKSAVMADGPTNYWRLGDSTGSSTAADAAGFSAGTYNGTVTRGAAGVLTADGDTSATFNGSNGYVSMPSGFDDLDGGLTVEAWVNPSSTGSWARIVDLGNGAASDNILFARNGTSNDLTFEVYNGGSSGGTTTAANALVLNTWQHVAATVSSSGAVTIYRNGSSVATGTTAVPRVVQRTNNYIGRSNWASDAYFGGGLDEVALYPSALSASRITAHYNARTATSSTLTTGTIAAGTHRIRVDYQELIGNAALQLTSSVAGTTFAPRYNLTTSEKDDEGRWTKTEYATPELGLATATVRDPTIAAINPGGLNLRSTTTYEPTSPTGFRRRTSRTLPKGSATMISYAYYGITETANNPCPGGATGINQAGALKSETEADPDGAGPKTPIVREYRYDRAGRVVAQRILGDPVWTCTAYDNRGRITSKTDSSGKTQTFSYSQADRATETATDSDGVTRTTVAVTDWLGRRISYTDQLGTAWETVTRTTYDQAGRVTATYRALPGGSEAQLTATAYDAATGRVASDTEYASGTARTTTYSYNAAGQPTTVTRPNGVTTTTGYDTSRGWATSLSNTKSGGTELSRFTYGRSIGGGIASEDAVTAGRTRTFGYDGAGRLTSVGGTTSRTYAWDADTNRCANAATCATPTFTYDNADRLLTSPYATASAYDGHGNMTSATPSSPAPAPKSLSDAFSFDATGAPPAARTYPVTVGRSGTFDASLDWTDTGAATTTTTTSGSLGTAPASSTTAVATGPFPADGQLKSSLTWDKALHRPTEWRSLSVPGGSAATTQITTDATADIVSTMDWGVTTKPLSASGSVSNVPPAAPTVYEGTFTASGNGRINLTLTWDKPSVGVPPDLRLDLFDHTTGAPLIGSDDTNAVNQREIVEWDVTGLGTYPSSRTYRYRVSANTGFSSPFTLTGNYPVTATMDFQLLNATGTTVLANSTQVSGTTRRNLTYANAPAGTYTLRASSSNEAANPSINTTYSRLDWANLTLALKNGSTTLATTSSSSGTLNTSYVVPQSSSSGTFNWVVTNGSSDLTVPSLTLTRSWTTLGKDTGTGSILPTGTVTRTVTADGAGFADVTVTWNQSALSGYADLTVALKNGSTVIDQRREADGSISFSTAVPAAGTYTVSIVNNSVTADVPSYTANTRFPQKPPVTATMTLKDGNNNVVATAGGTKPKTLSASVQPGSYTVTVSPTNGKANATLSGTYPDYADAYQVSYDANDHATRIVDGRTVVDETLSPSGRVLRRVVTDYATGAVSEDTRFGYAGPGDSPAWSRPTAGGPVTTYLDTVIDTAGTASYPITNLQGDIVGRTDSAGNFTATPVTDEFGVGGADASRLGWLGGHERFTTGGGLALIRMGVRLYDPRLGRFLAVDPVEGGSANDYDYVAGDPVNNKDLDGTFCMTGVASRSRTTKWDAKKKRYVTTTTEHCRSIARGAVRNRGTIATVAAMGGCVVPGVGWAACAGLQAGAWAVRSQQRGYRKFGQNGADGLITAGTFGLVGIPAQLAARTARARVVVGLAVDYTFYSLQNMCRLGGSRATCL